MIYSISLKEMCNEAAGSCESDTSAILSSSSLLGLVTTMVGLTETILPEEWVWYRLHSSREESLKKRQLSDESISSLCKVEKCSCVSVLHFQDHQYAGIANIWKPWFSKNALDSLLRNHCPKSPLPQKEYVLSISFLSILMFRSRSMVHFLRHQCLLFFYFQVSYEWFYIYNLLFKLILS